MKTTFNFTEPELKRLLQEYIVEKYSFNIKDSDRISVWANNTSTAKLEEVVLYLETSLP